VKANEKGYVCFSVMHCLFFPNVITHLQHWVGDTVTSCRPIYIDTVSQSLLAYLVS